MPVIQHYSRQGKVATLPAGRSVDEVYEKTQEAIMPVVINEICDIHKNLVKSIGHGDHDVFRYVDYGEATVEHDVEFLRQPFRVSKCTARIYGNRAMSGCHLVHEKNGRTFTEYRAWKKKRGLWICTSVLRRSGAIPLFE